MSGQEQGASTPGALLGAARRKQGLHIVSLAAQLKVSPARLEALEADRWQDLPDPTHARALATSVCRVLGIDAAPVLAGMPKGAGAALERVSAGLNEPVRSGDGWPANAGRWLLLGLLLLALAAALRWWPTAPVVAVSESAADASAPLEVPAPQVPPAQQAVEAPATDGSAAAASVASAAAAGGGAAVAPAASVPASQAAAPVAGGSVLEIEVGAGASWVSVTDAAGQSLASKLLQAGERLSLQPRAPVRVILGNAPAVRLSWRGEPQPLDAYQATRVAKLELK